MENVLQHFIENTPELLNFLAGYFPEAEFTGATDEQIVHNYISTNTKKTILQTQGDLETIKKDPETLKLIAREVNKHFENTDAIWNWVENIKEMYNQKASQL